MRIWVLLSRAFGVGFNVVTKKSVSFECVHHTDRFAGVFEFAFIMHSIYLVRLTP